MGSDQLKCILIQLVCFSLLSPLSASSLISGDAFGSSSLRHRNLLQAPTPCPVNFEIQNYTIITSQCRGPNYPPSECCAALVEFACPYAEYLNDLSNNCATTMFSYITRNGQYPPGLFSRICREGELGLSCPPSPSPSDSSRNSQFSSHLFMVTSHLILLLFM